uniref:Putative 6.4 kDa secreted protein n=1 Tax=Ixodes scapularis TaxID=6945 RepID=Q8MVA5_IXOSC|nr:putative 6.4 kDa secreted protein [Ixodes scapularis]
MKLVVFAVVLILSAVLSADFSSGFISVCDSYIVQGGDVQCGLRGSYYSTYDPKNCTVICENEQRPELPKRGLLER